MQLAQINLGYTQVRAPTDGFIGVRQVFPGQYIAAGSQVAVLAALPNLWVLANYKETQLTHVSVGQSAQISVDTFPGSTLRGHVIAIAPASGAEFALLPPDNATGNFTKIVQRIVVKISVDDSDGLIDRLRPGMSVIASIDTKSLPSSE
jgi:membrane fusion protein (multidrug efflux system)